MLSEKAALENCLKCFMLRTAWLYGNGNNFVKTMLRLAESKSEINVVGDQIGTPTNTVDLAKVIPALIETEKHGIYHAINEGFCSWYEFACEIFKEKGIAVKVNKITSEEYKSQAKRPAYSVLENKNLKKIGLNYFRYWKEALHDFLGKME